MGFIKKYAKKGAKAVKRRYTTKKGKTNITKMVSDIKKLQMVLNPEKKRYNIGNSSSGVSYSLLGQVNVNTSGYLGFDITPLPAQGITDVTRNGDSIKLFSMDMKFQLMGQLNNISDMKVKWFVVKVMGQPYTSVGACILDFLSANTFNGLYDYNSDRVYDKMGLIKIVRQGTWSFKGLPGTTNAKVIHNKRIGLKFKNQHIKYVNNTTTIGTGQMYLLMFSDSGNVSSTVSTLPNIPNTAASSGLEVNYDFTSFFYDN